LTSPPASRFSPALDEETARAELYGLLAQLYYAPPSARAAGGLRVAVTEAPAAGGFLRSPGVQLVARRAPVTTAPSPQEYDRLFGGVGKPEVYLYGSHYLSGFLNEKPLARLRTDLAGWGWRATRPCPKPRTTSPTCAR
jgi:TorA maturation chaperone TorD